ncbi:hypothetical protein [Streptomyces sp. NPDC090298]|uniref:hypothetical protein n=1 Tax=Streptomyces sp. NPDC090298 TaxID=3365959 RepID=UPI003817C57E
MTSLRNWRAPLLALVAVLSLSSPAPAAQEPVGDRAAGRAAQAATVTDLGPFWAEHRIG